MYILKSKIFLAEFEFYEIFLPVSNTRLLEHKFGISKLKNLLMISMNVRPKLVCLV